MMLGRTPAEAVAHYIDTMQQPVSCVTNAVVGVDGGYYVSDMPHTLSLNRRHPVRLAGTSRLWIAFRQYYRIVESELPRIRWTVIETGYEYSIMDADQREILAYHWHPTGRSSFISQHIHIGHGAFLTREELHTAHLPTGYVSLSDIIRLLIGDLRVTPRRSDWQSILSV